MIFITTFCTKTWEQLPLSKISNSFSYGLNVSSKKYDGKNKYIRITDIDDNSHKLVEKNLTSPNTNLEDISDYQLKENDLLFARTGASVGKSYLYDNADGKAFFAGFLIRMEINGEFDKNFVFQNTLTDKYQQFIKITSQRSGQPGINAKEYASFKIIIPKSFNEQRLIGKLYFHLDNLITLQQSQIDYFLKLRKGLIQRIFPSNKASNPKIRYTDFNNNWEQRKLKEVTKEISNKSSEGELLSVTINDGIVKNSSLERKNNSSKNKSKYKKVEIGDIAYNSMRMWQGASGVSKYSGIVSPAYTVFKVKKNVLNNIFLGYSIKTPEMTWKFRINSQGLTSDTWNLKYPLFSEINIQIPSLKEQNYLVNLLESIDKVICSQTKHLKTLKLLKKYFLQKLFM
ncbi:restriction endonuclease subunit S [Companilactobacillus musae]|uniref:restriction endonuclease subunit S n=1 Tax=Companilactobacillus musae TaxID=1903258 RepID=UPI003447B93A